MQPRLHVTIDVTTMKGLGLNVSRVLLAINVKQSDNGPPFIGSSNAISDTMAGEEVVSLIQRSVSKANVAQTS